MYVKNIFIQQELDKYLSNFLFFLTNPLIPP